MTESKSTYRIAFVKDWHDTPAHIADNKDGILAAFDELAKRHNVQFVSRHTHTQLPDLTGFDVIVSWGSIDRPWNNELPKNVPALLCFAGGPTSHPFLHNFQHVFVESQVYLDDFTSRGISCSRAFGTNTNVFFFEPRSPKILDSLYPASFCAHKDHEIFSRAIGSRGLAVGNFNDIDIVGKLIQLGTPTLNRVSSAALCCLYNLSKTVCIPNGPMGGSQRVVLESMACGTPVVCSKDNDRCAEFIIESGFGKLADPVPELLREAIYDLISNPIDPMIGVEYIRSKWTHIHYANELERSILNVLNGGT